MSWRALSHWLIKRYDKLVYLVTIVLAGLVLITPATASESPELTYHAGSTDIFLGPDIEPVNIGWNLNATTTNTQTEPVEEKPLITDNDTRVLCNCFSYVKEVHPELPRTSVIRNNITHEGNIAVFYYPTSGVYHYAVVTSRNGDLISIDETNYRHCQFTSRNITLDYPYLLGFYNS